MMSPARSVSMLLGALLTATATTAFALPSSFPTGTTYYDPERAYNGFVLFPGGDRKTHLIDMNGNEVHRWDYESFPPIPLSADQADGEKGHLLVQLARADKLPEHASPGNGLTNASVAEVNWDGEVKWQWGSQQDPVYQHHDMRRLPNGNNLVMTAEMRELNGFDYPIIENGIEEVDDEGRVVWEWKSGDHLDEMGFSDAGLRALKDSEDPDFLHLNTAVPVGPNRLYDAGDERFAPDNILVNSRNANVTFIVDRQSGEIVWRIGPDLPALQLNGKLGRPVDQTVGSHDAHFIPEGLPGAGNLLIFDNQGNAGFPPSRQGFFSSSRVIEVDPSSDKIVWQYTGNMSGRSPYTFYSSFISSARRLPNGNTLIDEGQNGRLFQVTPEGDIVWEYVSPFFGKSMPSDDYVTNQVYRAQLVDYDWAPDGTPHTENSVMPDCDIYVAAPGCHPGESDQPGNE
ncbi:ArsR family transcriptional regulator [Salinicola socius]|uniref:ArsR family transcriptional regulator n=2 Tax=Salinicola socius TaxID=404433 RepID=A0A1Q8SWN7_9GAMM|nr:ArsR family transcriptional regulator [Salinicola socius]